MKKILIVCATVVALGGLTALVPARLQADNSWGGYHWARTSNPFTLKVGDNVNSNWQQYFDNTVAAAPIGWTSPYPNGADIVRMTAVAGGTNPKNCRPTRGRVEVCNSRYGNNGWLGLAQIWASGLHITQGVVKLNDTYYTPGSSYDTYGWRNMVVCQEVGHTLGLDHQDVTFGNPNLGTCMDYTDDPDRNDGNGNNWYPNLHDYDELAIIYNHTDSAITAFMSVPPPAMNQLELDTPGQWGRQVRSNGRVALFDADFGNGHHVFTFVIYAS